MAQVAWDNVILFILVLIIFSWIIAILWLRFIDTLVFEVFHLNPLSAWHRLVIALAVTVISFAAVYLFNQQVQNPPMTVPENPSECIEIGNGEMSKEFDWNLEKIVIPVKNRSKTRPRTTRKTGINTLLDITDYSH